MIRYTSNFILVDDRITVQPQSNAEDISEEG